MPRKERQKRRETCRAVGQNYNCPLEQSEVAREWKWKVLQVCNEKWKAHTGTGAACQVRAEHFNLHIFVWQLHGRVRRVLLVPSRCFKKSAYLH